MLSKAVERLLPNRPAGLPLQLLIFDDVPIHQVQLLGMSRCGLLSWSARLAKRRVKIYECFNDAHALLIEKVSRETTLKVHFPNCLFRRGRHLVVDWVEGKSVNWQQIRQNPQLLEQVARLQATLHAQFVDSPLKISTSLYIDFLKERWRKYQGILPIDEALQKISLVLEDHAFISEERLSHSDVTAANLILEYETGLLKLVDNELLMQNNYYLIDLFNTYKSFGHSTGSKLLEPYLALYVEYGGDLTSLREYKAFFSALWQLRLIGSLLQSGAIEEAARLAQQYLGGEIHEHRLFSYC